MASPQVLERVGVASADLVAAVTQNDELNLIVALTAKQLGARKVAARVFNPSYFEETRIAYRNVLGIDLIIAPHILTARVRVSSSRLSHRRHGFSAGSDRSRRHCVDGRVAVCSGIRDCRGA